MTQIAKNLQQEETRKASVLENTYKRVPMHVREYLAVTRFFA